MGRVAHTKFLQHIYKQTRYKNLRGRTAHPLLVAAFVSLAAFVCDEKNFKTKFEILLTVNDIKKLQCTLQLPY
jgi:hypothetical protein